MALAAGAASSLAAAAAEACRCAQGRAAAQLPKRFSRPRAAFAFGPAATQPSAAQRARAATSARRSRSASAGSARCDAAAGFGGFGGGGGGGSGGGSDGDEGDGMSQASSRADAGRPWLATLGTTEPLDRRSASGPRRNTVASPADARPVLRRATTGARRSLAPALQQQWRSRADPPRLRPTASATARCANACAASCAHRRSCDCRARPFTLRRGWDSAACGRLWWMLLRGCSSQSLSPCLASTSCSRSWRKAWFRRLSFRTCSQPRSSRVSAGRLQNTSSPSTAALTPQTWPSTAASMP